MGFGSAIRRAKRPIPNAGADQPATHLLHQACRMRHLELSDFWRMRWHWSRSRTSSKSRSRPSCGRASASVSLIGLLQDKDVLLGAIDVATSRIETPEEVADAIRQATVYVEPDRILPCTNCGLAPLPRGRDRQAAGARRGRGARMQNAPVRNSEPAPRSQWPRLPQPVFGNRGGRARSNSSIAADGVARPSGRDDGLLLPSIGRPAERPACARAAASCKARL
jgi:Cobalamin-independent synthase, Catalytic domain